MERSGWLTYEQFSARLGERFDLAVGDGASVAVELAEATESSTPGGTGPDGQSRQQFSLVFSGPVTPALPQATYRLDHAELGELHLFLVPIAQDAESRRYEAAFA